ncbi:MAG: hypothetical protein KME07_12965 [Pegethrix bostrychoides GSE-TBD4-15B]|jgi:hypothetical protein|uniref:Uncharacterized protein n=1 Tax=Pegethrix bostrychoides GSE-TBD4-15B TaxID=2839662 RepID=A0A951PDC4_9CYAN|nr:hypothetical protein [Pegethrix bostrychoides GSE-TBD4-15B]
MQRISDLKRKSQRFKLDSSDILPLAFVGLSTGMTFLTVAFIWLAMSVARLANQPPPTLVQQVDGRAYSVRTEDYSHREPEVIRKAVSDWAVMTFSWGNLPGKQSGTVDAGVPVKGRKRVPTSAWEASFLLAPDFRDRFLSDLAEKVIPVGLFESQVAGVLVPQTVSPPQLAGNGRWKVDMVATRILFDGTNPSGYSIPFNRTFYVRAVDPPRNPLVQNATEYQQVVYQMLESGLQIEQIQPFEEGRGN